LSENRDDRASGDAWSRVTIVLTNRQIVYLDRLSADIRARTGAIVKRTEIIRALVDHLADSELDAASARSENDLRHLLTADRQTSELAVASSEE
jgi:hypothetical protein